MKLKVYIKWATKVTPQDDKDEEHFDDIVEVAGNDNVTKIDN